jgi:hypothetical protein
MAKVCTTGGCQLDVVRKENLVDAPVGLQTRVEHILEGGAPCFARSVVGRAIQQSNILESFYEDSKGKIHETVVDAKGTRSPSISRVANERCGIAGWSFLCSAIP